MVLCDDLKQNQNRFDLGISMQSLILGTVPTTSCSTGFAPDHATGLAFPAGDAKTPKVLQKACSPNAKKQDASRKCESRNGSVSHCSPQGAKLHERRNWCSLMQASCVTGFAPVQAAGLGFPAGEP